MGLFPQPTTAGCIGVLNRLHGRTDASTLIYGLTYPHTRPRSSSLSPDLRCRRVSRRSCFPPGIPRPWIGKPDALLLPHYSTLTHGRHFHWMAEHGVDGAFFQRFASQCDLE